MYYPAELVLKSYKPLFLDEGMLFITKLNPGTRKEYVELWELKDVPVNMDEFLTKNGHPVELQIVINDTVIAEHGQIGWFDAGEDTDELYDATIKEFNIILADYDGQLEIDMDEDGDDDLVTVLYQDKVTISYPIMEQDEDILTDLDVWTNGRKLGNELVELDGEYLLEHCVEYDDRLWIIVTDRNNELKWPYTGAALHPDDDSEPEEEEYDDMDDDTWKEN